MSDPPSHGTPERPALRVRRPLWLLLLLVATCAAAGSVIHWLIRSAQV